MTVSVCVHVGICLYLCVWLHILIVVCMCICVCVYVLWGLAVLGTDSSLLLLCLWRRVHSYFLRITKHELSKVLWPSKGAGGLVFYGNIEVVD